jgi:hypothetical protein
MPSWRCRRFVGCAQGLPCFRSLHFLSLFGWNTTGAVNGQLPIGRNSELGESNDICNRPAIDHAIMLLHTLGLGTTYAHAYLSVLSFLATDPTKPLATTGRYNRAPTNRTRSPTFLNQCHALPAEAPPFNSTPHACFRSIILKSCMI